MTDLKSEKVIFADGKACYKLTVISRTIPSPTDEAEPAVDERMSVRVEATSELLVIELIIEERSTPEEPASAGVNSLPASILTVVIIPSAEATQPFLRESYIAL